ncbi:MULTISPECIES: YitT family protein [Lactobacillus]|uniref:YitT family protein n=1 Tax=Lactobacillus xujianguonis TaxID=2495899 RepID=A0A437SXL6_9LACO|nr:MULTISPECIES: YitT family protein [Lactobacillus]RVU71665.1 YitT family protein [Lactobacillus xujianguonis]RVU77684.1 YitT family protein [Lactobacillus xujianguonis]
MKTNLAKHSWMRWLLFIAGLEIIAISINLFYGPINIAAGGTTGISILVDAVWGINRSITVFVVNVLLLIVAWIFLGKTTTKNIALGSLILPLLMQITPSFKATENDLLAVIYGGALMGLGVSLLYRVNASSGGTTIIPMILKKYFYLNPAVTLLCVDMIVIIMNIFVDGWNAFFLAAFSQLVTAITMNYTETGFDKKYQVRIMSNTNLEAIRERLQADYQGLTIYDVVGGYSDDKKKQLLIVVDTNEYGSLITKIHEIDPDAFIITSSVAKVHGGRWGM